MMVSVMDRCCRYVLLIVAGMAVLWNAADAEPPRVGVFQIDASPTIGSPLAYDPCVEVTDPLLLGGVVILGSGDPIVIGAVDWIGVANEAHRELRRRLAEAAGTTVDRVSMHALHQHDAPRVDFSTAMLLDHQGVARQHFDVPWARDVFRRAADAVSKAVESAQPFDRIGLGQAEVNKVASNRRLMDADGTVIATRYTACRDPELRAMPTGTIDPLLRCITFFNQDRPLAVLTYYATHPQSYYRTGQANPDFPGYARNARQQATGIAHIHFNGAGGNIGAGKWNDGSKENRQLLTQRVADGMRRAFESMHKLDITAEQVGWSSVSVALPPAEHLDEQALVERLDEAEADAALGPATALVWLRRCLAGDNQVDIGCLQLGPASVLHMPGELFVEYQLAAATLAPQRFVAMAAYGDYAPGYIGTRIGYTQGGYETSARASRVAPEVEQVLVGAMKQLLDSEIELGPLGVPHDGLAGAEASGDSEDTSGG